MTKAIIYGIPNCDTVKKTFTWFNKNKIPFQFHNYKTDGITAAELKAWCTISNWEILLNKKSTTWKNIDAARQATITTKAAAIKLMQENTSIIKRPVVEINGTILVGFNEAIYEKECLEK
jgi:Spx/MgsR family transcriptional regulator